MSRTGVEAGLTAGSGLEAGGLPAFKTWLRACVAGDGRSVLAISRAAGINYITLRRSLFDEEARPTERNAVVLAHFFHTNPDVVLAWLGHPDPTATAPDPAAYSALDAWLRAALAARNLTAGRAALGLGIRVTTLRRWLDGGGLTRPSIALLAAHFGVDRQALIGLQRKQTGKALAARHRVERLGLAYMQARAAHARSCRRQGSSAALRANLV